MKPRLAPTIAALALACLFVAPAVAADRDTVRKQLEASAPEWKAAKKACSGNYEYTVRFSSWVGFGHETTIVVRANKIVERRFRSWNAPDRGPVPPGGETKKPADRRPAYNRRHVTRSPPQTVNGGQKVTTALTLR